MILKILMHALHDAKMQHAETEQQHSWMLRYNHQRSQKLLILISYVEVQRLAAYVTKFL
jgi:hypothetical protein